MSILNKRVISVLTPHIDAATIATLTNLKAATPEALNSATDALVITASVAEAEGSGTTAAITALCAGAVGDVNEELALRPPARPSLGTASARVHNKRPTGRTNTATVLTASGSPIDTAEALADAFNSALRAAQRSDAPQTIARQRWTYPEERQLSSADSVTNAAKLDAVVSPEALVASGGICNPIDVDFSVNIWGTPNRPLRDGLASFGATRGGLRFMAPPSLASVGAAGTTVWTEAIDSSPGTATKPVLKITCGSEEEVFVDAIPTRIQLGNMAGRFYPEYVTAVTDLCGIAAARVADLNILSKISASSTTVSSGQLLGAARDFLGTLDAASAAMRYRNRLDRKVLLRAVLPEFLRDIVRGDLAREMANAADLDNFVLPDNAVDNMLSARGIQPIWLLDGNASGTHSGVPYGTQGFGAQSAGALLDFPHNVQWWLFPEGSFVLLDGGSLEVGLVRDSTLDASNDYEIFQELFEGVAYRGVESLEIVSSVRPNGLSGGTKDTSTF